MSRVFNIQVEMDKIKLFQDSFLDDAGGAYKKTELLPSHDQWCGIGNKDILLLQRQKSMRDGYNFAYHEANIIIKELEEENEILKSTMELYANEKHWSKPYTRQGVVGCQVKIPLHTDGGKAARSALNYIGGIKNEES